MKFRMNNQLSLISLFNETGEEWSANCRNCLCKDECHPVVEGLGTDNSVLFCVHDKTTNAWVLLILFVPFGQEIRFVDCDNTFNVFLSFAGHYLSDHHILVDLDCIINLTFDHCQVALAHFQSNCWFNQLNQTLDKKILNQFSIFGWVLF